MNNAQQLLNRAMNVLELEGVDWLAKEIRDFLSTPEPKQDDEPVATLDHNGNFELLKMVGVTFGQPINLYEHPAPKQDDEPVAWLIPGGITERKDLAEANRSNAQPLYLHPAPRKHFVRLTDEEIMIIVDQEIMTIVRADGEFDEMMLDKAVVRFVRAIEDALEEKNK